MELRQQGTSGKSMEGRAGEAFGSRVPAWVLPTVVFSLLALVLVSYALGRYAVSVPDLLNGVYNHFFRPEVLDPTSAAYSAESERIDRVIFNIRGPRIMLVCLVGAALACSGAAYQGMFKNPLVSPDILGSSAGASMGACLAMLLNLGGFHVQLFAFIGGLTAVSLAVLLNRLVKYDPTLGLVLGGILVSSLFSSGTSFIKLVADAQDQLPSIQFWLMGSFNRVDGDDLLLALVPLLVGFVILIVMSWRLNVLSFGDDEARAMGINTRSTRLLVIFASTLLASVSVAVAGIIGYVGLVVPHLARAIVGPNYKLLLPASLLVGAIFLLIIDNIARVLMAVEIPIGILTAIVGVPFFVVIFRNQMRGWK
jgi:iron complex transport system permease protein